MIISKITSGLGNQLFQYALGRTLSLQHQTPLKLDLTNFNLYKNRKFSLNHFKLDYKEATAEEIAFFTKENHIFKQVFKPFYKRKYLKERMFAFDKQISRSGDNVYLQGYWQSENYFKSTEATLRQDFKFRNPPSANASKVAEKMNVSTAVSLHIRRGDYVSNPAIARTHGVLPIGYYQNAIKIMASQVENQHLFIFSDDLVWTKTNLNTSFPITYVENNTDVDDLWLMSQCKHHIVANSSFSWWGAWLNPNTDKLVLTPKRWFLSEKYNPKDIIPESWQKIAY
ncbi:MAG: alpha-1,2-fucosyltransferase [Verrucomicrobia bacterium]|nr:alpha-1,2-fucosyltransferase [Cytophagales bacterium]